MGGAWRRRQPCAGDALGIAVVLACLAAADAQCSTQQEFHDSDGNFIFQPLESGVPANETLCPQHWVWYRIRTRKAATWTSLQRSGSVWSQTPVTQIIDHGLSIMADAGYDEVAKRFTTLSLLVVNGTPPITDNQMASSNPYDAASFSATYHRWTEMTDRETVAFGYNYTLGPTCQEHLDDFVYIAMRCLQPQANPLPCAYNLTVTLLPHTLQHGMEFDAYLEPAELAGEPARHYYHVNVSAYETLEIEVERRADGQSLSVTSDGPFGQVLVVPGAAQELFDPLSGDALGVGMLGGVFTKRMGGECPTNFTADGDLGPGSQMCALGLNDTAPCTLGSICTTAGGGLPPPPPPPPLRFMTAPPPESLDLVIMVEAEVGSERPLTFIDEATSQYALDCESSQPLDIACEYVRNVVDKNGQRPAVTSIPDSGGALSGLRPRYNVPQRYMLEAPGTWVADVKNELRVDRAVYRLRVTQLMYEEGSLVQDEGRPGCVAYGQMRRYTLTTTNARDGALTLHALAASSQGLGALYVGENYPPTESAYTAMVERADPSSAPLRLSLSLTDLRKPTTWHIGVMLEPGSVGIARGVVPTTFSLSVHKESALLLRKGGRVRPRGADNDSVPAKGVDGDGFVCCGVIKYYLVPGVPDQKSVHAHLNVTRGFARALYLKASTYPAFPADVEQDACLGQCVVAWLTKFNPYDGTPLSTGWANLSVPNGIGDGCPARCPADLRRGGDWYVGVQALPGTEADFSLVTTLVDPPHVDRGHQCDPHAPECRGPVFGLLASSASRRRGCLHQEGRALGAALIASALAVASLQVQRRQAR